jgi:group I intron endonuclease
MNDQIITNELSETLTGPAVYQIHNPETGEFYIGATTNIDKRIKEHIKDINNKQHSNAKLQDSFSVGDYMEIVTFPVPNPIQAFEVEKILIENSIDNPNCLNIRRGRIPPSLNRVPTEEERERASKLMKAKYSSGELTPPMKGKNHTDRAKKILSAKHKALYENGYINPFTGKQHTEETKRKHSEFITELWTDPDHREAHSKAIKEWYDDPEHRLAHGKKMKEVLDNPETRQKLSNAAKQRMADPEFKQRISDFNRERASHPDERKRLSEIAIKQWQDPAMREHLTSAIKERMNDPTVKEHLSKVQTERMKDPVNRDICAEGAIKQWQDPAMREHLIAERRKKWADPEYRAIHLQPTIIDGVTYPSVQDAINSLGISNATYYRNLKRNNGVYVKEEPVETLADKVKRLGTSQTSYYRNIKRNNGVYIP